MSSILNLMSCQLSKAMKEGIDRIFTASEIKQALDQLTLRKSPVPNGLSVTSYRNH